MPIHLDTFSTEQGLTQNSITCSITDQKGFHWFATQGGLNRFDGYDFIRYQETANPAGLSGTWLTDCLSGDATNLWFSTASKGVNLLNTKTGLFSHYHQKSAVAIANNQVWSMAKDADGSLWLGHDQGQLTHLDHANQQATVYTVTSDNQKKILFRDIIVDKSNTLWLASSDGLFRFDKENKTFVNFPSSPKKLWSLALTDINQLLIAGREGLSVFDVAQGKFTPITQYNNIWLTDILITPQQELWLTSYGNGLFYNESVNKFTKTSVKYKHTPQSNSGLVSDYLLSVSLDTQGIMWIGTDGYGLHRYDYKQRQFNHQNHQPTDLKSISNSFVRAILKDSKNQLWVGTREGLNKSRLDKNAKLAFTRYVNEQDKKTSLSHNNIFSLYEDTKGNIWVGTYGGGLLRYLPQSDDFFIYTVESHHLASNRVYAITGDDAGNLWLGSNKGLTRFNPDNGNVKHYKSDTSSDNTLVNDTVFSLLYEPKDKTLWIGTRNGLSKLETDTERFSRFQHNSQSKEQVLSLSNNMVTSLAFGASNTLWVGTFQGLNQFNTANETFIPFTNKPQLLNQNIFSIKRDNADHLWLSTNQGLIRYQVASQALNIFSPVEGIQHNSFILGAAYQASDGELFFGGVNGFNHFYPEQLIQASHAPDPVLTEILVFNQPVNLTTDITIDFVDGERTTASYAKGLSFNESHGVIGFQFSALNSSASPKAYQYAYMLSGLDEQWLYTSSAFRQVSYSQLAAGNYQLLLKAADQYGQWSPVSTLIDFIVVPPWWKSSWAYLCYFLLVAVILALIIMLRFKAKLAEQESKKQSELNQLKSQFLDNMSHELKTPLSLIIAPLEGLQAKYTDSYSTQQLGIIKRNSAQLLSYIEQLLQLSKQPGMTTTLVSPYYVNSLIKAVADDFTVLFEQKNIRFTFTDNTNGSCTLQVEQSHLTTILNNLLSNALKYTHEQGQVEFSVHACKTSMTISCQDNGIGIAKAQHSKIFERFTRLENQHQKGSGIGLALVKQLVEQYHGTVTLTSELGKGSCFNVVLPQVLNHPINLQTLTTIESSKTIPTTEYDKPDDSNLIKAETKTLLIVEDNPEMRALLHSLFAQSYYCVSCENGEQGLVICQRDMPDLVISDVMMPKMDGYQLLQAIRENTAISHIPVLLLSAKSDTQSKIKGLDLLADDYLSKPFQPSLLKSRVQALLGIRQILNQNLTHQLYQSSTAQTTDEYMVQSKDYDFTQRLKVVIDQHYQSESFTVEQFAQMLHLSSRALQLKMKSLYDLTPSDYIRNTRLAQSKLLLRTTNLAIGTIAEQVGFGSQSYFARCFKTAYEHSPKQYRDSLVTPSTGNNILN